MVHTSRTSKIFLIMASILLVTVFSIFILEKTQVVNLYAKPIKTVNTTELRPTNNVENKPATSVEQDEAQDIKQNLMEQANNSSKPPTGKIDVSLSAANQDIIGGPLVIRSIVSATSGTCNLVVTNGTVTKTYSSDVVNLGTYYSCKGFDIPISDLSSGKWQVVLAVSNDSAKGEIRQEVDINK